MYLERQLKQIKTIAILSGKAIIDIYNSSNYSTQKKSDNSPLTEADLASNKIIVEEIKKYFPEHGILSEEIKDNKERLEKESVWIIDPLDGTKEFISRNGEFTVNIALVYKGRPVLGVIYVPVKQELYYAIKGEGAFFEKNGKKQRINVSDKTKKLNLVKSRSHASEKLQKIIDKNDFGDIKTAGSSLKGCLVAKAEADVYYRLGPINEWDICAMDIIVNEAGGKMTDLKGSKILYNKKDTLIRGFLVSNNKIHDKLLQKVKEID